LSATRKLNLQGVAALCKGLKAFIKNAAAFGQEPSLKVLRLNKNRISDTGVLSLAQLIDRGNLAASSTEHPLRLKELGLSRNPMGAIGIQTLLRAVSAYKNSVCKGAEVTGMDSLGNSPQGVSDFKSPGGEERAVVLRRLGVSWCDLNLSSLGDLAAFLASTTLPSLPTETNVENFIEVNFEYSNEAALKLVDEVSTKTNDCAPFVLTSIMLQLTKAVESNKDIVRINIGALANVVRDSFTTMSVPGSDISVPPCSPRLLHDLHNSLGLMCRIKDILALAPAIVEWMANHPVPVFM
jgi:hypothetical protein